MVWTLFPHTDSVVVSLPDGTERVLHAGDVLAGDPVLPGFRVPVRELFQP
jgi:hypothetical protein